MNLVEQLIRTDKNKFTERQTKKIKSARLSRILGTDAEITIQELSGKRLNDLTGMLVDRNGKKDFSRLYDTNLMYCVYGVIEPSLQDEKLQEHFGAKTPLDLAKILFDSEAGKIADEIVSLSGLSDGAEEEVKNS